MNSAALETEKTVAGIPDYEIFQSSAVLYSIAKTGKSKCWQGHIMKRGHGWFLSSSYWQEDESGSSKVQFAEPYQVHPTNEGRANYRDAQTQASFEFTAMIKKQMDRGYHEKGVEPKILTQPMLAHKFKDHGRKIKFPAFVQPKLNGMRMLWDGKNAWSRGGKMIVRECVEHLMFDTKGLIVDGELILPGNALLQETLSAAKKFYPEKSPTLLYCVYDVIVDKAPFSARHDELRLLVDSVNVPNLILVETHRVESAEDVHTWHGRFTRLGFEGTMVRDDSTGYERGTRSYSLQKYKDFLDAEYEIVGVEEGEGSDRGLAIFVCRTPDGKEFRCRPEGERDVRMAFWDARDVLIGERLTVRFQELSADGIPIFPVGVALKNEI